MLQSLISSCGRLFRLGRRPSRAAPAASERRIWVRHPTDTTTGYQPANAPGSARLSAGVQDVSYGGVQLLVDRPFDLGALLCVDLPGAAEGCSSSVLAYVVRVTRAGQGQWALGCTFAGELQDDELEQL